MPNERKLDDSCEDRMESLCLEERRVAPRFELPIPVKIRRPDGFVADARIKNISATGCRIETSKFVPRIGSQFSLKLLFLAPNGSIRLRAQVVRHTGGGEFAARFLSLTPRLEGALRMVLPALASECGDDETVTTWTGELLGRLGPDLHSVLGLLANETGTSPSDLLRACTRKGLLKIGGDTIANPKEPVADPDE